MVLGERIKRIRTFRGLTQRELGLKLGYEERNADVRIAQVVPKILCLHSFGLMKMTVARSIYFSLYAIPASATLLMINQCVTMTMTTGLHMPRWVCG